MRNSNATRRRDCILLLVAASGCLPLLYAAGQTPMKSKADTVELRAKFGVITASPDKTDKPASEKPIPFDKDKMGSKDKKGDKGSGVLLYAMPVTPPKADQLFRLDSEETFRDRLRTEVRERYPKIKLEFPESDSSVGGPPTERYWPTNVKWVEPSYVISNRLFFEQPRFERYGTSVGILQPIASVGIFGFDVLLWPARRIAHPFQCYQVNTDCYSPYFLLVGED